MSCCLVHKEMEMRRTRKRYGIGRFLLDLLLIFLTGGLWLFWIVLRYLRTH